MWQATYRAPGSCGLPASAFLMRYVIRAIYKIKIQDKPKSSAIINRIYFLLVMEQNFNETA
jgi:hypothetical protein